MLTTDSCQTLRPGHARLEVERVCGQSAVTTAWAVNPLRLLTPVPRGPSVWAYTSSFGGGHVAGDQTRLEVKVRAGARCFISTQAVTKAYRNPGLRPCGHAGLAQVDEDGVLVFAPDPVQAFASAAFTQFQEWHLHPGAGLVLLDWFCSGRAARGERWAFARFQTRNDVFVGDELIFRDALALESSAHSSVAWHRDGRFDVFALLLLIGTPLQSFAGPLLAEVNARPIERAGPVVVGASRLRDGAVLRIAGATVEAVAKEWERHLRPLRAILGDDPWRRKW